MNVLLYFCLILPIVTADISEDLTFFGNSGSKKLYMSNAKVKKTYIDASNICKCHKMVLARLETQSEYDDFIAIFKDNIHLPDRAYVGLSLVGKDVVDQESKTVIPYSIPFYFATPFGDGSCLEIMKHNGHTGVSDIDCFQMRHFICENQVISPVNISRLELESTIKKNKEEITMLQKKSNAINIEIEKCLRNLTEIETEKRESELNQFKQENANLTSELRECHQNQSHEINELQTLHLANLDLNRQIKELNEKLLLSAEQTTCQPDTTNNYDPIDVINVIDVRMGVECENGGTVRSNGNNCDCRIGFTGDTCQHKQPIGQAGYMVGNGYVELNRSSIVDGGPSQNRVSFGLRFSTTQSKGLLFWFGQDKLESSNEQDFIALYIEDGHLVYAFRLNGIEYSVSSSVIINNGQQCHVIVKQVGNVGSVEITDYNDVISGHSEPINKEAKINLPGNAFLGGAPYLFDFTGGRFVDGFVGCIHLVANEYGETIDLGQNAVSGLNIAICPE